MSKKPQETRLSPAQEAALDHDGDGKAGGSLPHAEGVEAPRDDAPLSDNADTGETDPETEEEMQDDGTAPAIGADASARVEDPAAATDAVVDETQSPLGEQPLGDGDGAGQPQDQAAGAPADADAPAVEDEDQTAAAPIPEDENQALALEQGDSPLGQGQALDLDKAIAALRDMASNRYGLYRRIQAGGGYSSDPAGGGLIHAAADVDALLVAGLARVEPSGGQGGSVKITDAGREQLALASAI